jgi:hypothetical protein
MKTFTTSSRGCFANEILGLHRLAFLDEPPAALVLMPLTPCHAAAAWPLVRVLRLPLAAVVIGTMAPDFEYLLRLRPSGNFGHTLLGVALFCVPLSLGVWAVFSALVRPWLEHLLPLSRECWSSPHRWRDASRGRRLSMLVAGVVAGSLSHIGWDAFTHFDGWGVRLVPALAAEITLPATGLKVHGYTLLQHGSTLVGGTVVVAWAARTTWISQTVTPLSSWRRRRLVRTTALLIAAIALGAILNGQRAWARGVHHVLAHAAVGGMVALAVAVVALAVHDRPARAIAKREAIR